MDLDGVRYELARQDGVVSRRQLLRSGCRPHDLDRLVRRRDLSRMLPGVFVDHTGSPTWLQRAWCGVLFHEPAALAGETALRAVVGGTHALGGDSARLTIAVDQDRHLVAAPGFEPVRLSRFAERIQWNTSPPRQRTEDALLDLAGRCPDDLAAVHVLADAIRARHTTAARLGGALAARPKQSRRTWLDGVLADLSEGTCSVLEHGYLVRVERAHGLPRARRQRVESAGGRAVVRDVRYERYDVTVELNGRLFHDGPADWDADLERELDAAVRGAVGLRLGWGQVFSRTCRTARAVATVLRDRGWQGHPRPCHEDCSMRGFPVAAPHHVR